MHISRQQLADQLPGNYGGETLREYCGLAGQRFDAWKNCRFDNGGITSQRLFIAIGNHKKKRTTK